MNEQVEADIVGATMLPSDTPGAQADQAKKRKEHMSAREKAAADFVEATALPSDIPDIIKGMEKEQQKVADKAAKAGTKVAGQVADAANAAAGKVADAANAAADALRNAGNKRGFHTSALSMKDRKTAAEQAAADLVADTLLPSDAEAAIKGMEKAQEKASEKTGQAWQAAAEKVAGAAEKAADAIRPGGGGKRGFHTSARVGASRKDAQRKVEADIVADTALPSDLPGAAKPSKPKGNANAPEGEAEVVFTPGGQLAAEMDALSGLPSDIPEPDASKPGEVEEEIVTGTPPEQQTKRNLTLIVALIAGVGGYYLLSGNKKKIDKKVDEAAVKADKAVDKIVDKSPTLVKADGMLDKAMEGKKAA